MADPLGSKSTFGANKFRVESVLLSASVFGDVTSPFKDPPRSSATCNRCDEEFTYHPTYGVGRICKDCKDAVDDPANCTFDLSVTTDAVERSLTAEVTVSHDEPHKVHIPADEVIALDETHPSHLGVIACLEISDGESVRFRDVLYTDPALVMNPERETQFNINHEQVLGCDGSRTWTVTWGPDHEFDYHEELAEYVAQDGSPFDSDELTVRVTFPAIEQQVPESTLETTVDLPTYTVSL